MAAPGRPRLRSWLDGRRKVLHGRREEDAMTQTHRTPREDGFSMPAEWEPHAACLMEWPTVTRAPFWAERFEEAKRDYAAVATAITAFEPVVMVCDPEQTAEVRRSCGDGVEVLPLPIDDSWMRDNGPIFVRDEAGRIALVQFRFNSWGEKYLPYDKDAQVPRHIAAHFGMRRYDAPFVLEGGSFFVDGEGTLITTEQCLLNPNRNPTMSQERIERGLRDYLGVEVIVWLGLGHSTDRDTDGHIDGIAPYLAPATVALLLPEDPADPDHERGRDNLDRLQRARDARGREFDVIPFQTQPPGVVPYLNFYLANGGAVVPVAGRPENEQADEQALEQIAKMLPDREIVPVPGDCLNYGGGGPHCITQQRPTGVAVPA
jgi:agmatine deiminase